MQNPHLNRFATARCDLLSHLDESLVGIDPAPAEGPSRKSKLPREQVPQLMKFVRLLRGSPRTSIEFLHAVRRSRSGKKIGYEHLPDIEPHSGTDCTLSARHQWQYRRHFRAGFVADRHSGRMRG